MSNDNQPLNILVFGAHPDDCDFRFGGAAMLYRKLGHRVRFVSMTNGDTGHFSMGGGPLARRRYEEAQASAAIADIEYEIMDVHNGQLEVNLFYRQQIIEMMRRFSADLVLCHRPCDYHPDHRAVGVLVQDAAYVVTVPNVAALTPALPTPPVVGYLFDNFTDPTPYRATVAISIDEVIERKIDMAHCHVSQVYEWLPYSGGRLDDVPDDDAGRREWLSKSQYARYANTADSCRDTLVKWYGEERGRQVKYAESVMISEYGRPLSEEQIPRFFPFFD